MKMFLGTGNDLDLDKGKCYCVEFFKEYICCHILGIKYLLKGSECAKEAAAGQILTPKAKPGRKAKSKSALKFQKD